jgi:Domain of unknown function (DUF4349)
MTTERVPWRRTTTIMGLAVLLAAAGCGSLMPKASAGRVMADAEVAYGAPMAVRGLVSGDDGPPRPEFSVAIGQVAEIDGSEPEEVAGPTERMIVYTGRFSVAVGSIETALRTAREMAEDMGGYVQSLQNDTVTLRIPAARFDDALEGLRGMGRILSRSIETKDVTEDVVDLRLRLRNAMALRDRLAELLARAETVEAALKVETELSRVRTEIERIEGRLLVLSKQVSFSTLTVRFVHSGQAPVRPQALPFPWLRQLGLENLLGLQGGVR